MKAGNSSNNIHVFRVNRAVKSKESTTITTDTVTHNITSVPPTATNSRTSLSAETKRSICEDHIKNPKFTQEVLAKKYGCKRTTIAKIVKCKERWLAIDTDTAKAKRFRQRSSRYPVVENAVMAWLEKEHNNDITHVSDNTLRSQARQYAQKYHVEGSEEFKASSSWVINFKQRYINQKESKKEGSATPSLPTIDTMITCESPTPMTGLDPVIRHDSSDSLYNNNIERPTITHTSAPSTPTLTGNVNKDTTDKPSTCTWTNIITNNENEEDDAIKDDTMEEMLPSYSGSEGIPSSAFENANPHQDKHNVQTELTNDTILEKENNKSKAKQHLEAALAFYTSQKSNQSMSADMIKLILQNDF